MKKILLIFCVSSLILSCGSSSKSNIPSTVALETKVVDPTDYASTITSEELKTMLYKYASDEFEGRETGEKGQKMAVEYLKEQYKTMGVATPLGGDDYFQEVPLEKQKTAQAILAVDDKPFNSFEDHIVLSVPKSIDLADNSIVYVGYGIDDDNYSDYKDLDVKGKIILVKSGEPKDSNGNYVTSGTAEETKWSSGRQSMSSKRDAAIAHGAKVMLLMDNDLFPRYAPYFKQQFESGASGRLNLKNNEEGMAFLMINENLGKAINPSILENHTPKVLSTKIDLAIKNQSEAIISENVVAYIKGSEKPEEIVVLSAHLDHEGIKNGEVYNGADDDGSGTIALIEIAEAFKTAQIAGHGPKRSILFLHVTGEEKGLLGSKHYTDNDPIFPLENTVVDLNIDMIGRIDPKRKEGGRNYVYLIGSDKLSSDLHNISEEVNKKYMNVELDYTYNDENDPNRFYYRSDHYNFAKNNIPVIFYFNGTHDDYHKPTDTPDKIEYDLLENRTRLVFYTAWEVANRDQRIIVDKASK
jgi:hypothetical protein